MRAVNDATGAARKSARIAEVSLAMLVCPYVCAERLLSEDHHPKSDPCFDDLVGFSSDFLDGKKIALSQYFYSVFFNQ